MNKTFAFPIFSRAALSWQVLFIILAFLVPLFLIIGRGFAEIVMGIVCVSFLIFSLRQKSWAWASNRWFQAALVAWVYLIFSGLLADADRIKAVTNSLGWIRFPLFSAAFAYWILPQKNAKKYFMPYMAILLGLVAIDTVVQFVFGMSLSGHAKPDYQGRLSGPFDRLVVGVYLERLVWPVIGLFFGWALANPLSFKRVIWPVLFSLLVGGAILLSGERMSAALFGLCALVFFAGAKKLRLPLFAVGSAMVIVAVSLVLFNPTLKERFVTRTAPYLADLGSSPYGSVWHNGLAAWRHSPILGVGLSNFVPMCEKLGREGGFINEHERPGTGLKCVRHPHNIYIEWLALSGVIGLSLFLVMIGALIYQVVSNLRIKNQSISAHYAALGYLVGLIPFLWPIMSSMSFFTNWSAILFWWIVGIAMQSHQLGTDKTA